MPHNWVAYEAAQMITDYLVETGVLKFADNDTELKVRGVIQIVLEDNYRLTILKTRSVANDILSD